MKFSMRFCSFLDVHISGFLRQGVANAAQLEAIHHHLSALKSNSLKHDNNSTVATTTDDASQSQSAPKSAVTILPQHVETAFATARPSMSLKDRLEHEAAYR